MRRFKFDAALDLADALAQRLLEAVRRSDRHARTGCCRCRCAAARLRERGYNQAWELARRVARRLPCATDARLLLRMKDTPHQVGPAARATRRQRARCVRGRAAAPPRTAGRSVAVLDDVMTTGATAAEIARTLLQAGARSVQVWVLARTPTPDGA